MKLQGRNLQPNARGEDVKLLQSELRRLKLKTQIVDPEGFFGSTTFLAVQEFQRNQGLEATGTVDEQTARLINKEVDEIGDEMFVVRGEVRQLRVAAAVVVAIVARRPTGEPGVQSRFL